MSPSTPRRYLVNGVYNYSDIGIGFVVCGTGSGTEVVYPNTNYGFTPGTRCGQIKSKSVDQGDYYDTNSVFGFGLQVDICTRDGDGGGPLWSQIDGNAYGVLSGGPNLNGDGHGPCNMSSSHEYSVYSPLSQDLLNAKDKTGITFSLVTSSMG